MAEISKEKREWMESVGMKEFKEPMKFYIGPEFLFSEDYIKNTPLAVLQERFSERRIPEYGLSEIDSAVKEILKRNPE